MCEHKLYLRPEKCEFEKTRIEYLGVIISHNKVEIDPVKIAGVADWLTPSNKKEVQSFVGFVNFYQQFIPGFSHHVHLEGARHPVEIWTDHKNLEYFRVAQKSNCQQARWSLYLSCFNFTLHHKPGRSMGKPDALSRWANHGSG
jgi:hypothetical protein